MCIFSYNDTNWNGTHIHTHSIYAHPHIFCLKYFKEKKGKGDAMTILYNKSLILNIKNK